MPPKEVADLAMTTPAKPVRSEREERYHLRVDNAVQVWRVVPLRGKNDKNEFDKKKSVEVPRREPVRSAPRGSGQNGVGRRRRLLPHLGFAERQQEQGACRGEPEDDDVQTRSGSS